ncbi:MAG: type VI secretion system contractile sheath domain-containing protein [Thermodesulfobacteriota bacterium]
MSDPISFEEPGIRLVIDAEDERGQENRTTPFRLLVLGDFSGRASRGLCAPVTIRPRRVDRDNLDELLETMAVEIRLSLENDEALAIPLTKLDDLHPDRLFHRLDIFASLRKLRRALRDPAAFAQAAPIARSLFATAAPPPQEPHKPVGRPPSPGSGNLLDQIIAETTGEPLAAAPPATPTADNDLAAFVGSIVAPHLQPKLSGQDELIAALDRSVGDLMRAVLHHPQWQEIEAAWRAVDLLVRRLPTGEELAVFLLDVSREEVLRDLAAPDPRRSILYRLCVEQAGEQFGTMPWAALIGLFSFAPTTEDITLLHSLGRLAAQAGTPFIAAAHDTFLGTARLSGAPHPSTWQQLPEEIAAAWQALRRSPEASWLGLVLPRLLLRLPYGEQTNPIDSFAFEECDGAPEHDDYLWGNPALACGLLLGVSFAEHGWMMRSAMQQELDSLPLHIYTHSGETRTTPCAEVLLTEKTATRIMEMGFMPLLSFAGQDRVRLGRFQSVSSLSPRLAGRWS